MAERQHMNYKIFCCSCLKEIDLNHDYYRKVTDMQRVTRHWHMLPTKDCWDKQFQPKNGGDNLGNSEIDE